MRSFVEGASSKKNVVEAKRIKNQQAELSPFTYCCHRRVLRRARDRNEELPEVTGEVKTLEHRFQEFLMDYVAPVLNRGKFLIALAAGALVGMSIWSIMNKSVGYKPRDLVPKDSSLYRPLELSFGEFTLFPSMLCFLDVDVPSQQSNMLDLYSKVTATETTMPGDNLPFLSLFYYYVFGAGFTPMAGQPNKTLADEGWRLNNSWTHPQLAPLGIASSNPETFYTQYSQFVHIPLDDPMKAFLPGGNGFAMSDAAGVQEFTHAGNSQSKPLRFSFFRFYQKDLRSDGDYLSSLKEVRDIIDASPLKGKAFPYGPIFTYWSVFLDLNQALLKALVIDVGVIFICTWLLLCSPTAALLGTLACGMIVLEVYGICMLFLQFNIFIAAAVLAATGISVEFTAHIISSFYLQDSSRPGQERLGRALADTCPAVLQGSVSTLLSIAPMALTPVPFVTQYMFSPFAIVVAIGLLNGLVILPALMVIFVCRSEVGAGVDKYESDPNKFSVTLSRAATIEKLSKTRPPTAQPLSEVLPVVLGRFGSGSHPDINGKPAEEGVAGANGGIVGV